MRISANILINAFVCIINLILTELLNMMFPLANCDVSYRLLICYGTLVLFLSQIISLLISQTRMNRILYLIPYLCIALYWKDTLVVLPHRTWIYLLISYLEVTIYLLILHKRKND